MKYIERKLMESKKYTRYQVQKIIYLIKTLGGDLSKVVILGVIFHKHFSLYLAAMLVLFPLRSFSGGLHNNTYFGCFMTSLTYFSLSILILPQIIISFPVKILLLTGCMVLCEWIGPITSKYRPPLSLPKISICKSITVTTIFAFIFIANIIPKSPIITVGFWVVILHTLQLMIAKCIVVAKKKKRKEDL